MRHGFVCRLALILTLLFVCFLPAAALAAPPPGYPWSSLWAFVPLLVICLILLIPFLVIYRNDDNKKNKVVWLKYYTYVSLPFSTLLLITSSIRLIFAPVDKVGSSIFTMSIAILICFVIYGLHKRRMWGWMCNWTVLSAPVFLDLVYLIGSSPEHIGLGLGKVIGSLLFFMPNYIYFKKRKLLFEPKIPVLQAETVFQKENKIEEVENSDASVEKKKPHIDTERERQNLGEDTSIKRHQKKQNERAPSNRGQTKEFPYKAALKHRIYTQLLKEERDEATMLQAKVACDGDIKKAEATYYKLRVQQMVESGEIACMKKEILTEKRQQEEKRKKSVLIQVLGPQTEAERQTRIEDEVKEIVREVRQISAKKAGEEEAE